MSGGVKQAGFGQTGVTLIELLVVMAIIGIVVLVGVNMMGGVLAKHRVGAAASDLATRLKAAKMLAVVRNRPVTVIFNATTSTYHACLDTGIIGDCTDGGDFLNLDSGRPTGTLAKSEIALHANLDMYGADFGDANPPAVTYMPPSGLPVNIMSSAAFVNGSVCFVAEPGDEGDAHDARYAYRRISVNPIVGKVTQWKNAKGIVAQPVCGNADDNWDKVF